LKINGKIQGHLVADVRFDKIDMVYLICDAGNFNVKIIKTITIALGKLFIFPDKNCIVADGNIAGQVARAAVKTGVDVF
jgi:hypothetical protein